MRRLRHPEHDTDAAMPDADDAAPADAGSVHVGLEERDQLLLAGLLRRAAEGRRDPSAFFSFVMREEHGERRRIKATPHQRVLFSFVSHHDRCVVRMPPGFSKTYCMSALSMQLLGQDNTARGAVISSTQEQASKVVGIVRDYIGKPDQFPELRLVFPELRPSTDVHDPWTQVKLCVARPAGIRDPSLCAVGYGGALPGSRLSWILVDDILDEENTRTPHGRRAVKRWFDTTVLSRRDVRGSKIVVTNTAWHPDDLTYALEASGWPTLTMTAEGDIEVSNADPGWDTPDIRPSRKPGEVYRLAAHDVGEVDADEAVPLWPTRFSADVLAEIKSSMPAFEYAQLYKIRPRSDEDARCKREWIERCKARAREAGVFGLVPKYDGEDATFTGVDLAVGQTDEHARTSFFTFRVMPNGVRVPLDIESGRWTGPEIVRRLADKTRRYNSIARVENNAAQEFLIQFALDQNAALLVRAHTTGRNKVHPEHGVEALFVEIENGAWLIPNDPSGNCPEPVQEWIDAMLYYKPPPAHTEDVLMACWFAREEARECGFGSVARVGVADGEGDEAGAVPGGLSVADIMAR